MLIVNSDKFFQQSFYLTQSEKLWHVLELDVSIRLSNHVRRGLDFGPFSHEKLPIYRSMLRGARRNSLVALNDKKKKPKIHPHFKIAQKWTWFLFAWGDSIGSYGVSNSLIFTISSKLICFNNLVTFYFLND